jgi:hypothetical protein
VAPRASLDPVKREKFPTTAGTRTPDHPSRNTFLRIQMVKKGKHGNVFLLLNEVQRKILAQVGQAEIHIYLMTFL